MTVPTPKNLTGTPTANSILWQWQAGDSVNLKQIPPDGDDLLGTAYGGGYIVRKMTDADSKEYILICSDENGDSYLRESSTDGVPDSAGSGWLAWAKTGADGATTRLITPSHTDGLANTEAYLDAVANQVATQGEAWTDYPIWNFCRLIRAESMGGYNDWYIPARATGGSFGLTSCDGPPPTIGDAPATCELSALFWYLLRGWGMAANNTNANRACTTANYYDGAAAAIEDRLYPFFKSAPDSSAGSRSFEPAMYWGSYDLSSDQSLGRYISFKTGLLDQIVKTTQYRLRLVRRVYI